MRKLLNFLKKQNKPTRGFTLIELLVVMVLLAILVAMATGSYASSTKRGRDNRRKADLKNISTALELYFNDKGRYPSSNVDGQMVGCGAGDTEVCDWGGEFKDQNNTLYMVVTPSDPNALYQYYYTATTTSYVLYAFMENTRDEGAGIDQDGYTDKFNARDTNCSASGAVKCTYAVSSTNITP